MVTKVESNVRRVPSARAELGIHSLKFRLLAALSGVTVSVACAGRSERTLPDRGGGGSSGADTNAGSGGAAPGGRAGGGGASGSMGGAPAGAGGSSAGNGGVGARRATLGCTTTGEFASGLEACDGSFVHRTSALACPQSAHDEPANGGAGGEASVAMAETCQHDFDCDVTANAYCVRETMTFPVALPFCLSSCETDADCAPGQVCSCDSQDYVSVATGLPVALGLCVGATCATDADCDAGLLCIAPILDPCGATAARNFHCQSPTDECSGPGDCGKSQYGGFDCQNTGDGHYVCSDAVCGRPFLVAGSRRQSEACASADWRDHTLPPCRTLSALDHATRGIVAEHFRAAALMEHASIAAFARFSLQLLALGAPPELLAASARAMADETRHAELCFELASRYGTRDCGPGPLALDGALDAVDLASVVELAFVEGCVGETAAALEASWAAEAATEPLVREVLARIAADEERHALLAFRFVSWALERDARLFDRLRAQLYALATPRPADAFDLTTQPLAPELAAHGVLSAEQHRAARSAAVHEIVPALLASLDARGQRTASAAPSANAAIHA